MTTQPANPRARRRAVAVVALAVLVGGGAILAFEYFERDIADYLVAHADWISSNPWVGLAVGAVLVIPILIAALYLMRYARQAVRHRRLPPPGYALARPTQVLEGDSAVRRARVVQALAGFLLAASATIPLSLWYLLTMLRG